MMNTTTLSRRQGPTVAHVVQLLQTAYPKAWEQHLRNRLGATDPADLTPTALADFTDHVFWLVRQTGIRDPAAWLAFRAQLDAEAAAAKRGSPVEIGDVAAQRKSAARQPVALENSPATSPAASPPRPAGTVARETTKAEMPSRAKAAVEAGESPRNPPSQPASQPAPMNENLRSGPTQTEVLPSAEAATRETEGPKIRTTRLDRTSRKRGRSGSRRLEEPPAGISRGGRKRSPKLMRRVLDNLEKCPILSHAVEKSGIHRKTLEYWLKCSAAGRDGYDFKWRGFTARFHEHCDVVIAEAEEKLFMDLLEIAKGGIKYKTDPFLEGLGFQGGEAFAKDEYGIPIVEAVRRSKPMIYLRILEMMDPERWAKPRKRSAPPKGGGVWVVGGPTKDKKPASEPGGGRRARG